MKDELTPKQIDFLDRYLDPKSATYSNGMQSALDAGYAKPTAQNILIKMKEWKVKKVEDKTDEIVTKEQIINGILAETTADNSSRDRLTAWKLLGEYKRLFIKEIDVNLKVDVIKGFNLLPSDEGNNPNNKTND